MPTERCVICFDHHALTEPCVVRAEDALFAADLACDCPVESCCHAWDDDV